MTTVSSPSAGCATTKETLSLLGNPLVIRSTGKDYLVEPLFGGRYLVRLFNNGRECLGSRVCDRHEQALARGQHWQRSKPEPLRGVPLRWIRRGMMAEAASP